MNRVWFEDLQKAVIVFRARTGYNLFSSITGNAYGDFVFTIDTGITYVVKHKDFSVWHKVNDQWQEVKRNLDYIPMGMVEIKTTRPK